MSTSQPQPPAPVGGARARSDVMTLLAELGRVLKGRSFYGPGDANLARIFERTLRAWQAALERHGPLELTVGADGIAVPELGPTGLLAGQFSSLQRALSIRGIHSLQAEPGLDAEAFAALVEILVTDPARLSAEGGVAKALSMRAPFAVFVNRPPAAIPTTAPEAAPVAAPEAPPVAVPETAPVAAPTASPVAAPAAAPVVQPEATPTAPTPPPEITPVLPVVPLEAPPLVAGPPPIPPSRAPIVEDEAPAPATALPTPSLSLPGDELLLPPPAPLEQAPPETTVEQAPPETAEPVAPLFENESPSPVPVPETETAAPSAGDDMLFDASSEELARAMALAPEIDLGNEADVEDSALDDAPTLVDTVPAPVARAEPRTETAGNEDLTIFSNAEPLELDEETSPASSETTPSTQLDFELEEDPSFDLSEDSDLLENAGDPATTDPASENGDPDADADATDESVTWFADAVASTPDFTGSEADSDSDGATQTRESESNASPDGQEPAAPSHYVQEILAELDACGDAMQYRELAERAMNAGEVLCEQGLTNESFPILAAFARHSGDDGKRDPEQQETAQQQLKRLALGSCKDDLFERACGDDATSLEAVQILTRLGSDSARLVLQAAETERSAERRERLHGILIAMGESVIPELARAMKEDAPARVRAAIRLAGELQNPSLVPQLAERLGNGNATVSQEAARALARLGDETSIEALARGLSEGDEHVATNSANALASTASPGAVEPLLDAMRTAIERGNTEFARDVIRALGRLGQPGATTELAALLLRSGMFQRRRHRELKLAAASAIGRLPGDEAVGALAQAARSRDTHIRRAAQIALDRRSQALTGS